MAAVTTALDTLNTERDAGLEEMKRRIQEETAAAENKSIESCQARIQEMANQAVEASAEQIRSQVEKSAEAMAEKALQEWQAKLESDPSRIVGPVAERIQEQVGEALSGMEPKLHELQEQAVNEALEAFRGRLLQFIALLPSGETN
jgi:hypothetical protein